MRNKETLLTELNNYLYSIHNNNEVSETETRNALDIFLEYFFTVNGLNLEDYDILIHSKPDFDKDTLALIRADYKQKNKYEIFLNKHYMKMKSKLDLPKIVHLFLSASHEFKHIIQYETDLDSITNSNIHYSDVEEKLEELKNSKDKKLKKLYTRYLNVLAFISFNEKSTEKFAFKFLINLLDELKKKTEDYSYSLFLELCIDIVKDFRLQTRRLWDILYKDYHSLKDDMNEFYDINPILL